MTLGLNVIDVLSFKSAVRKGVMQHLFWGTFFFAFKCKSSFSLVTLLPEEVLPGSTFFFSGGGEVTVTVWETIPYV